MQYALSAHAIFTDNLDRVVRTQTQMAIGTNLIEITQDLEHQFLQTMSKDRSIARLKFYTLTGIDQTGKSFTLKQIERS